MENLRERIIPNNLLIETMEKVLRNFILPAYESKAKATGNWGEALEVILGSEPNSVEVWGADYSMFTEVGRREGKQPPTPNLIRWVEAKFGYSGDKAVSVAWAVANKIKNKGTDTNQNPHNLISLLHSDEVENYIIHELSDVVRANTRTILSDAFKEYLNR